MTFNDFIDSASDAAAKIITATNKPTPINANPTNKPVTAKPDSKTLWLVGAAVAAIVVLILVLKR